MSHSKNIYNCSTPKVLLMRGRQILPFYCLPYCIRSLNLFLFIGIWRMFSFSLVISHYLLLSCKWFQHIYTFFIAKMLVSTFMAYVWAFILFLKNIKLWWDSFKQWFIYVSKNSMVNETSPKSCSFRKYLITVNTVMQFLHSC